MKPLILKIKGINSFLQEETIDFKKLSKYGIFGIFGPTGSGKSSILDAMTIALYDKISRNSKEFINKETDSAWVYLEFEIKNGGDSYIYAVERSYKTMDGVMYKTTGARFIDKTDKDNIVVVADKSTKVTSAVIDVIGIGYEDFTRSVVLPQGKFSEFLTLRGKDRRDMLERIFRLEKYGAVLYENMNKNTAKLKAQLNILLSKIEVYGNVDLNTIDKDKNEAEILQKKIQIKKSKVVKDNEELLKAKALLEAWNELNAYSEKKILLDAKKAKIMAIEERLKTADKAQRVKPYLDAKIETDDSIKINSENRNATSIKYIAINKEFEDIKVGYDETTARKNIEHPKLIKRQEVITQVISLLNEMKAMEGERELLLEEYKKYKEQFNIINKNNNNLVLEREEKNKKLEDLSILKKQFTVSKGYREKIEQACSIEKLIKEIEITVNDINNKAFEIDNSSKNIKDQIENNREDISRQNIALEKNMKKLKEVISSFKYTSEDLIAYQQNISNAENNIAKLQKSEEERKILNMELGLIDISTKELIDKLESRKKLLGEKKAYHETLADKISAFEKVNMAGILSELLKSGEACPVCGSNEHPKVAEKATWHLSNDLYKKREKIGHEIESINGEIAATDVDIAKENHSKGIIEKRLVELNDILKDKIYEDELKNLCKIKGEFENIKVAIRKFEDSKNYYSEEIRTLERNLSKASETSAGYKARYAELIGRQKELSEDIKSYKTKMNNAEKELEKFIEEFGEMSFVNENEKLSTNELEREKITREEELLRLDLKKIDEQKEALSERISSIKSNLDIIETKGKEKKSFINDNREKAIRMAGTDNAETALECLNEIKCITKEIVDREEQYKIKMNEVTSKKGIIDKEIINLDKEFEILNTRLIKQTLDLNDMVKNQGFGSVEDLMVAIVDEKEESNLKYEYEQYKDEYIKVTDNIKRLTDKINGNSISSEIVEEKEINLSLDNKLLNEMSEQYVIKLEKIKNDEQIYFKIKELKLEEKKLRHKFDLYYDMADVMKGNRFVEFLAVNQLVYIVKEASVKLKGLTRGRYALEIDGGDFIIRDDFNGGSKRPPDTLSGGETFLTSFALALALSSKIQMKNKAPLQFFFMDEGFGTLDGELLDTVILSIESAKGEDFSIGIISHVEELQNRMPVRLIVSPPIQGIGGTKTKIDYL